MSNHLAVLASIIDLRTKLHPTTAGQKTSATRIDKITSLRPKLDTAKADLAQHQTTQTANNTSLKEFRDNRMRNEGRGASRKDFGQGPRITADGRGFRARDDNEERNEDRAIKMSVEGRGIRLCAVDL